MVGCLSSKYVIPVPINIIFRDPFAAHSEHVRRFFSEPFGRELFPAIKHSGEGNTVHRGRHDSQIAVTDNHKVCLLCLILSIPLITHDMLVNWYYVPSSTAVL